MNTTRVALFYGLNTYDKRMLSIFLKMDNWNLRLTSIRIEAEVWLAEETFSLAIMDYGMGLKMVLDFILKLRKQKHLFPILILVEDEGLFAHMPPPTLFGQILHLRKPFTFEELATALKTLGQHTEFIFTSKEHSLVKSNKDIIEEEVTVLNLEVDQEAVTAKRNLPVFLEGNST